MKRYIKLFVIISFIFVITGCAKLETNMTISKTKSMNIDIIYGLKDGDSNKLNNKILDVYKKNLKKNDYSVTGYNKDGIVGFEATKDFKNIDKLSDKNDVSFKLNDLINYNNVSPKFKVKKGLFKNHYYANISVDYEELFSNYLNTQKDMDLSFNVNLPNSAISSNATSKSNNDKTLKWNLANQNTILFEFSLYNYLNITIVCGIILAIIILFIIYLITGGRGNHTKASEMINNNPYNNSFDNNISNNNSDDDIFTEDTVDSDNTELSELYK